MKAASKTQLFENSLQNGTFLLRISSVSGGTAKSEHFENADVVVIECIAGFGYLRMYVESVCEKLRFRHPHVCAERMKMLRKRYVGKEDILKT